jgi:threonine-phosphate decarboxylase
MLTGHGNNHSEFGNTIRLDFSSNIAYNKNSAEIFERLKACVELIGNYPDPLSVILSCKISSFHSVREGKILVTNGSVEAFYLIAFLLRNTRTCICVPSFSEYEDACTINGNICDFVTVGRFSDTDFSQYQNVWLANPNNPDGRITFAGDILRQARKNPHVLFIVDLAYCELTSRKEEIAMNFDSLPANLITVFSLTKSFAIPGIRLGYIIASDEIISAIKKIRPPWSVNSLALEAGSFIFDNYHRLLPDVKELFNESALLQKQLAENARLEIVPSSCSFFLSRLRTSTARYLQSKLVLKEGILIRNASNFRGLDEGYFRLSAQSHSANMQLIESIYAILNEF